MCYAEQAGGGGRDGKREGGEPLQSARLHSRCGSKIPLPTSSCSYPSTSSFAPGRGWQDSTAVLVASTLSAEPDKGVESHRPSHCLHTLLQVHLRPGRGEAVSSRCRPCPVPFVVHYLCKLNEYIFFKSLLRVLLFHVDEKDLCCHSIITVQVTRLSYINMI